MFEKIPDIHLCTNKKWTDKKGIEILRRFKGTPELPLTVNHRTARLAVERASEG